MTLYCMRNHVVVCGNNSHEKHITVSQDSWNFCTARTICYLHLCSNLAIWSSCTHTQAHSLSKDLEGWQNSQKILLARDAAKRFCTVVTISESSESISNPFNMTEMNVWLFFFFCCHTFFYSQRVLQLVYQELEMWE